MVAKGRIPCLRNYFCLEGFDPKAYNPNKQIFCDACHRDMHDNSSPRS